MDEPTEKQIKAIKSLARSTNTSIDVNSIATKREASRILDELIAKQNGTTKNGDRLRDMKCAYGLATKLIFGRYQRANADWSSDEFWRDVGNFYQQYLQHQEQTMKLGFQR